MASEEKDRAALKALEARISAARAARLPPVRRPEKEYTMATIAWRMVIELVIGMVIGAGMGWGLDVLFGTLPLFLAVFSLLGFGAGVRTMMRTAEEVRRYEKTDAAGGGGPGQDGASGDAGSRG